MANLYGVANAPNVFVNAQNLPGNIACPANTTTTIYTTPAMIAPSNGYFFPAVWANIFINSGASISTGFNCYIAIGAGSYVGISSVGAYGMVANQTVAIEFAGCGPASQVAWQGAGSTVSIGISPATNACTAMQISPILVMLMRAPDQ